MAKGIYEPRGACRALFHTHAPEVLVEGPAGTGKSRAALEKLHLVGLKYPGCRLLVVRKTRTSITYSAKVTFDNHVAIPAVAWRASQSRYEFPTGSVMVLGGMDKPSRILSTEYDIIYVQEATELDQEDWETLVTRLRNYRLPYQQMIGDCNPGSSTHWLLRRADQGLLQRLYSKHKDNPLLWDERLAAWTHQGKQYLSKLRRLTGHTRERLLEGKWVSATGAIYPEYQPQLHLVDPFELPPLWERHLAIDFGYVSPFVCQWWAKAPDDTLYLYHQIYHTNRTVRRHSEDILAWCAEHEPGGKVPIAICDHDAEDRATLEEEGIRTKPANKAVSTRIENVKFRLVEDKIKFVKGSLHETDPLLEETGVPVRTEEEFGLYKWDGNRPDQPIKRFDHGMDAMGYLVMEYDAAQPARKIVRSMRYG